MRPKTKQQLEAQLQKRFQKPKRDGMKSRLLKGEDVENVLTKQFSKYSETTSKELDKKTKDAVSALNKRIDAVLKYMQSVVQQEVENMPMPQDGRTPTREEVTAALLPLVNENKKEYAARLEKIEKFLEAPKDDNGIPKDMESLEALIKSKVPKNIGGGSNLNYFHELLDTPKKVSGLRGAYQGYEGQVVTVSADGKTLEFSTATGGDSLPDQTGNNGKFLTTDGTDASWATLAGGGDMAAAVYDPNTVGGDAFDMDNMVEGTDTKILTAAERAAIIANTAKVTNATHTGDMAGATALTAQPTLITGKTSVTAAVADQVLVSDASDSNNLKRVTVQSIVDLAGGGGSSPISVDGAEVTDPDFTDGGDINFTAASSTVTATIKDDTVGLDELSATGTPSTTTFLRGDNSWSAITAGNTFNDYYIDQTPDNGTYSLLGGAVNGANTTFTVSEAAYATGTLMVWLNGQLQTQGVSNDFQETTPASGTFDFVTAPQTGDIVTVRYAKQVTNSDTIVTNTTERFEYTVALSDETTALTTGTAKITFRMPAAMTLTEVRASVTTAPTGANLVFDINEGGTSVLSTKLSIDATEKTSTTAATAAVISDSALADDAEMTIDIDQIGSTIAGAGAKVTLIGTYA